MDNDYCVIVRGQTNGIYSNHPLPDCWHRDDSIHLVGLPSMVWTGRGIDFGLARRHERLPRQLQPCCFNRCSGLSFHTVGRLFYRTHVRRDRAKRRPFE